MPRSIGPNVACVGLQQRAPVRVDTEPSRGLVRLDRLPGDSTRVECRLRRLSDLEQPVEDEQLLARLVLELAPPNERFLRERDPLLVGIGQAKDPRTTVARPSCVIEVELLVHDDRVAAPRERGGGCKAHHPGSDHVDAHGAIVP